MTAYLSTKYGCERPWNFVETAKAENIIGKMKKKFKHSVARISEYSQKKKIK